VRRLAVLALLALAGCGESAPAPDRGERARDRDRDRPPAPRCPRAAENCEAAAGRVVFLESVDPDGDGDLHLVIAGGSVTGAGLTVLDVSKRLRPPVDPRVGDWAAGRGPVFRGSFGQRQIQVTRLVVDPRRTR
jgi:hypothetical protein